MGKKKNTARQRRKAAARLQRMADDIAVVNEPEPQQAAAAGKTAPAEQPQRSWLGRFRKGKKKDEPEKEPWTRLQIAVFILIAVVIQAALAPLVVPRAASFVDAALLFVGPQTLLGAIFAQPIARRLLRTRALGVLETLTVGATVSLAAYFAQGVLVQPLITPTSPPSATATASPSPSSSQKLSSSPKLTAASTPSPTVTKASPTSTAAQSTRPCPVDDPNCNHSVPIYELQTAEGMADAVGILIAITFYPTIHRFFWMPKFRARRREERNKKAAAKSKQKSK
jgi:hypothetical protein